MNKFILKIRLIWFMVKSVFGTKIEELQAPTKEANLIEHTVRTTNTIRQFFEKYDVTKEDKVEYTNTHQDHSTNFRHLDPKGTWREQEGDKPNEAMKLLEIAGLIYEEDGRTPKNATEVFDMTYEEYEEYKKKIIPIAKERTIRFEEVQAFVEELRS